VKHHHHLDPCFGGQGAAPNAQVHHQGGATSRHTERDPRSVRMEALCMSIPCLSGIPEAVRWDPLRLAQRWSTASGGEQAAIQFVISVWDSDAHHTEVWRQEWGVLPFTLSDFARMDTHNRAAIAAWHAAPFWP
jgi:hypothetical protein